MVYPLSLVFVISPSLEDNYCLSYFDIVLSTYK
nr:MAG TPA: hypothetical protein [Caudoviricetes sp.]